MKCLAQLRLQRVSESRDDNLVGTAYDIDDIAYREPVYTPCAVASNPLGELCGGLARGTTFGSSGVNHVSFEGLVHKHRSWANYV